MGPGLARLPAPASHTIRGRWFVWSKLCARGLPFGFFPFLKTLYVLQDGRDSSRSRASQGD